MKKSLLVILLFIFGSIFSLFAQQTEVTGIVTSGEDGSTMPGVNVVVKGTTTGTTTDLNGRYSIKVPSGQNVLEFSYIGFQTLDVEINGRTKIDVELQPDNLNLDEVVVTALGISKEKKSLAYSTQQVNSDELTSVKDANPINALNGKVAGMTINKSASGTGGSTRITLRGNKSTRNNQPLYVVDGVPMLNYSPEQPGSVWGGTNANGSPGVDGGDAISNINPDDIESISVLKGATAAALYGSQAANGVIMITTKKGKEGKTHINFSSNFTVDNPNKLPDFQYRYGQTADGAMDSWGEKLNQEAPDIVDDFYKTGTTWINSISFSGGNKKAQTYVSYANTTSRGIVPENKFDRHNFDIKETASFFDGVVNLTANVGLLHQTTHNRPVTGLYWNPLTGLYLFPRGMDFNDYKENFEVYDPNRNLMAQNWFADSDKQQNPYWIIFRNPMDQTRDRAFAMASLDVKLYEGLKLIARGNIDKTWDTYELKANATTQATLSNTNGRYILQHTNGTQTYGELLLNYEIHKEKIYFSANAGGSIRDEKVYGEYFDPFPGNLRVANVFSVQNFLQPGNVLSQSLSRRQLHSIYASLQFGWKSMLYVDVTGRNDWSSTLPDQSYFYPSVGVSWVASELIKAEWLNFLKIRASYAMVGNDVDPYVANMSPFYVTSSGVQTNTLGVIPGTELKPEQSKSWEIGLDFRTLEGRLNFDFTYYNSNTENQFIKINAPQGSGLKQYLVNAGKIQNSGVEAMLELVPVQSKKVRWSAILNFTKNVNTVKELHESLSDGIYYITPPDVNNYAMAITEGGSFGDLYGKKFLRDDQGRIVVDANGAPLAQTGGLGYVGNPNPDFMLGFNNVITVGNFIFRVLIDGRFGGEVMSITQAMNDKYGVSEITGTDRDAGGVNIDAVYEDGTPVNGPIDAQTFYTTVGGRDGITEYYVYNATNVRLREFSIGYNFKFKSNEIIEGLKLSFVSRNLFFFYLDAPYDPDISMSTGTGLQGVDAYSIPSTRSFGLNLSIKF
jgi:TonB-linked SusC/RagA family outer membrane protein